MPWWVFPSSLFESPLHRYKKKALTSIAGPCHVLPMRPMRIEALVKMRSFWEAIGMLCSPGTTDAKGGFHGPGIPIYGWWLGAAPFMETSISAWPRAKRPSETAGWSTKQLRFRHELTCVDHLSPSKNQVLSAFKLTASKMWFIYYVLTIEHLGLNQQKIGIVSANLGLLAAMVWF